MNVWILFLCIAVFILAYLLVVGLLMKRISGGKPRRGGKGIDPADNYDNEDGNIYIIRS
jgi:hypothetical protein